MPDGQHQGSGVSGGPEWPVWLAAPRVPKPNAPTASAGDWLACGGVLLGFTLFCCAVSFAAVALREGAVTVLGWLALGHIPLAAVAVLMARAFRDARVPGEPDPPTSERRLCLYAVCDEEGVRRRDEPDLRWTDCSGFAYLEEDGDAFTVRLWVAARREPSPARARVRTALGLFAFFTPALVTIASAVVGYEQFGPRPDVLAAACAAGVHGLIVVPMLRSLAEDGRKAAALPYVTRDLLFDSRQVSATDALTRIGRYVPAGSPPDDEPCDEAAGH